MQGLTLFVRATQIAILFSSSSCIDRDKQLHNTSYCEVTIDETAHSTSFQPCGASSNCQAVSGML